MFNNFNYSFPNYMQPAPPKTNIEYVNGVEGARAFPIPPNSKVLLVDGDSKTFFIKTTDYEGKPTLERYSYAKYVEAPKDTDYVTMAQFNQLVDQFNHFIANDKVGGIKNESNTDASANS